MKRTKLIILFSIVNIALGLSQNAEDIFHFAGNLYINGNNKGAKVEIDRGLQQFPNDPKLTNLRNIIKDEEEKQQKQKNEDKQSQENQDKQQDQQNKQDNQQQDQQQNKPEDQQDKDNNQKDKQNPKAVGQISKEDAERLLNALEQQEKGVLEKLDKEKAKTQQSTTEKEW